MTMVGGLGIDLVKVARIEKAIRRGGERFVRRVYTVGEADYCRRQKDPFIHFSAFFAAKESFLKAIGFGIASGIGLGEIEIVHSAGGKPSLRLHGRGDEAFRRAGGGNLLLSLTHTGDCAAAVVIWDR